MWELECEESWTPKNWCFWTVVLEKTLESPLDCKEIQPVNPKGNQSWIFIGKTDVEAETPILWPLGAKSWLIGKDSDARKDRRQEEKRMTEDEVVGWHHQLDGQEFEEAPGAGDGQGSLVCCSPWSCRIGHDWVTELNGIFNCIGIAHFIHSFIHLINWWTSHNLTFLLINLHFRASFQWDPTGRNR